MIVKDYNTVSKQEPERITIYANEIQPGDLLVGSQGNVCEILDVWHDGEYVEVETEHYLTACWPKDHQILIERSPEIELEVQLPPFPTNPTTDAVNVWLDQVIGMDILGL